MGNDQRQILTMLNEGKITVEEAERLLAAVAARKNAAEPAEEETRSKRTLKYLRITEDREKTGGEDYEQHLNIRIPLVLLRAGAKLHSLLPADAREKIEAKLRETLGDTGVNLLEQQNMEMLTKALGEEGISIEIDKPHKKIRVFCE